MVDDRDLASAESLVVGAEPDGRFVCISFPDGPGGNKVSPDDAELLADQLKNAAAEARKNDAQASAQEAGN